MLTTTLCVCVWYGQVFQSKNYTAYNHTVQCILFCQILRCEAADLPIQSFACVFAIHFNKFVRASECRAWFHRKYILKFFVILMISKSNSRYFLFRMYSACEQIYRKMLVNIQYTQWVEFFDFIWVWLELYDSTLSLLSLLA